MEHPVEEADAIVSRDATAGGPLAGARILIVEDEVIIAMEIESNLLDAGATIVGPAHTLSEGLALARKEAISGAILDLRLGRDSVEPVVRALAQRGIPFIFYSGQSPSDQVRTEWPNAIVISKPVSARVLIAALKALINKN